MNRVSTFSIGGPLLGTPAYQAIVPQVGPLDKSGHFYLGFFEHFTIGRDTSRVQRRGELGHVYRRTPKSVKPEAHHQPTRQGGGLFHLTEEATTANYTAIDTASTRWYNSPRVQMP